MVNALEREIRERVRGAMNILADVREAAGDEDETLRQCDDLETALHNLGALAAHVPAFAHGSELLKAAEALGAMPEGYCFCSRDRIGDDSKVHEPECAAMRAAIAKARGQ